MAYAEILTRLHLRHVLLTNLTIICLLKENRKSKDTTSDGTLVYAVLWDGGDVDKKEKEKS